MTSMSLTSARSALTEKDENRSFLLNLLYRISTVPLYGRLALSHSLITNLTLSVLIISTFVYRMRHALPM